jgi:hypothetical protein
MKSRTFHAFLIYEFGPFIANPYTMIFNNNSMANIEVTQMSI